MSYKVDLTYFTRWGKFYTDVEFEASNEMLFKIWEEVDVLRRARRLPGLIEDHDDFIVLVEVPEHPHNHPVLLGMRHVD